MAQWVQAARATSITHLLPVVEEKFQKLVFFVNKINQLELERNCDISLGLIIKLVLFENCFSENI